jgi:hypothetical protein
VALHVVLAIVIVNVAFLADFSHTLADGLLVAFPRRHNRRHWNAPAAPDNSAAFVERRV